MTTTTETQVGTAAVESRRFPFGRVLLAFLIGVLLVAALAIAGVLAYEGAYNGQGGGRRLGRRCRPVGSDP